MPQPATDTPRFAVILAGGRGERFWPMSTREHPKQFLTLFQGKALIAHAVERLKGLLPPENILVITSADLAPLTRATLKKLPAENIIGEPCGRDTAPAVALAGALARRRAPGGATVAILTADQLMTDPKGFRQVLADCYAAAEREEAILTIGITPAYPSTGFGYIEAGDSLTGTGLKTPMRRAVRFVEKPDAQTAEAYLETGRYLWNAGMFIWRTQTLQAALQKQTPQLAAFADAAAAAPDLDAFMRETYPALTRISIDYAVMEHAPNIIVADGDFGWDDVGTWPSLEAHFPSDTQDNTPITGALEALQARGNIVVADSADRFTALLGVDDLVVVHAGRATLITTKARAPELKKLVNQLADRPDAADLF